MLNKAIEIKVIKGLFTKRYIITKEAYCMSNEIRIHLRKLILFPILNPIIRNK